jgi:hypothetical protein
MRSHVDEIDVRVLCDRAMNAARRGGLATPTLEAVAVILLAGGALAAGRVAIDFDTMESGRPPAGFTTAATASNARVIWLIEEDPSAPHGGKVLAQESTDATFYRFPLCIYQGLVAQDVDVSVKLKPVSGKVDQAGGIVVRLLDPDNYYVVRADAIENNVRLYRVVGGKRTLLAGAELRVAAGEWHTLRIAVKGHHFRVWGDGRAVFEADDATFQQAGKVGLWTKADSVIHFDELAIES